MMRHRAILVVALLWVAVVAMGSTLVWVVISRAGAGVVPLTQPQADVTGSLPVPAAETRTAAPVSPGVTVRPRPSRTTASASPRSTSGPTSGLTTGPAAGPTTPPASTSSQAPLPQRRSWSGNEGHVVAECDGSSVRLVTGFPNPGWRYAILARGPSLARVRYARIGGDDWSVVVDARCVAGAPRFSERRTGGGDD